MKVKINDAELRTVRVGDWTFRQADKVRELTSSASEPGLLPGDILPLIVRDDPRAALAFGIVAYMLAGKDPADLPNLAIEKIVVDYSEDSDADPPADGGQGAAATKKPAAKAPAARSRRKS